MSDQWTRSLAASFSTMAARWTRLERSFSMSANEYGTFTISRMKRASGAVLSETTGEGVARGVAVADVHAATTDRKSVVRGRVERWGGARAVHEHTTTP